MKLKISFFGKLGDSIGREVCLERDLACCTVAELRQALADAYPASAADLLSPRLRARVNDEIVGGAAEIESGDDVALLPPVSGG